MKPNSESVLSGHPVHEAAQTTCEVYLHCQAGLLVCRVMAEVRGFDPSVKVRTMLSKVPEVTIWFWVIKIQCTTVGESFADWVATTLGVGLHNTAAIFTAVLVAVLGWQMSLSRYVPFVYWLTVVVLSITGTLYTDILTDALGVPLAVSSAVFAAILAVVFGIWYARERTLSIHSITTTPREGFYWLAILVTFALGTAVGDWVLELTGWQPGAAVLLPAGLIAAIAAGWRLGANPVLAFWLAYILTRPLGANLGDWLARPAVEGGLGLGTAGTSVLFLAAILATVIYLTITRRDVMQNPVAAQDAVTVNRGREHLMVGFYAVVAAATAALLVWASGQPHGTSPAIEEADGPDVAAVSPPPGGNTTATFPPSDINNFRTIVSDTLAKVQSGDQPGAVARITDLETAWDEAENRLKPLDSAEWDDLDGRIDHTLKAIRTSHPDPTAEKQALTELLAALR